MAETTDTPTTWLAAVIHLLNEMAGEGICIQGCEDPCDLMTEIATHLGVADAEDPWMASIYKLAGITNNG